MRILENYHLVGVVCQNEEQFYYSMAKRGRQWYIFKPHVNTISEEQVTDLAHGTKMLFYKKKENGDTESESESESESDSSSDSSQSSESSNSY